MHHSKRKAAHVYRALRQDIVLGLRPPGDCLLEIALANEFEASQGTIREALMSLAEEGLVIRDGYRGTRISSIELDEAEELLALRLRLESVGIVRALAQVKPPLVTDLHTLIERMKASARQEDYYATMEYDHDFHLLIFQHARLPVMVPMLSRCMLHMHRLSFVETRRLESGQARLDAMLVSIDRHYDIVDTLVQGDEKEALRVIDAHIRTVWENGLAGMRSQ
ncbi:GntR family transcriptional regulator [Phytohalomonas tamaricis]|uniref:GntR family transcriptional regulator n=1 Tax=Phytohalomonas tamaricis TaxID=2081032 RepID=UPI000D0B9079|nr:GntR family transcriptional regulator [Phytohalomonas tamaricis]